MRNIAIASVFLLAALCLFGCRSELTTTASQLQSIKVNTIASSTSTSTTTTSSSSTSSSSSSTSTTSSTSSTSTTTMPLVVSYNGKVLVFQQFQAALPPIWGFGAQHGGAVGFAVDLSQNFFGSGGGVRGTYPAYPPGDVFVWGGYNIAAQNSSDIAIRFRAKMPGAKQGFKFIKVFGGNGGVNGSANTTFGLDYTGVDYGSMYCTSFGDGTSAANDTQNVIFFDGTYPSWIGRSYGTAVVQTPMHKRFRSSDWGTGWHKFELYVKFNSGTTAQNEMADGAYVVKIDDQVYVNAKGLFNRHYTNPPIDRVELFGWAQNTQQPFEIWYDNVEVSVGGFGNSPI